jgi:hypothetical protein
MKQYTTPEQTAKLIELGFEKPKGEVRSERGPFSSDARKAYSIGELIEMLPEFSCIYDLTNMHTMKRCWYVGHVSTLNVSADELIDALYAMIIKLKEEEVI